MRLATLNAHTDVSSNLCACRRGVRVPSKNGWQEIRGTCRCRSCWARSMYRTHRWFLGVGNFFSYALHIVDDQGLWKKENSRLHKWKCWGYPRVTLPWHTTCALALNYSPKDPTFFMQHGEMGGIEVSRMIDPFRSGESHIAVLFLRSHFFL